jgi:protein TonB
MRQKKNPQKDLNKKSGMFFGIGLLLVLALVYTALEWRTFEPKMDYTGILNIPESEIEEEFTDKFTVEKPKVLQILPQEIKIEVDDTEIDETEVVSSEVDFVTEVVDPSDFEVIEEPVDIEVNWITIEEVPIFPGCEKEKDKRACFNEMMQKHIKKNFNYPLLAQEMGLEGRVSTQFVINNDGSIGTIRKRGPHVLLENEAARILSKLPKMTPGKQRGTAVKVPFAIPITFKLQ